MRTVVLFWWSFVGLVFLAFGWTDFDFAFKQTATCAMVLLNHWAVEGIMRGRA